MATRQPRADLTAEQVRAALDYDPETGELRWAQGRQRAGEIAGSLFRPKPHLTYRRIQLGPHRYFAHRLAWLHVKGEWPKGWLDHRDGDGMNNRMDNLRDATRSLNGANSPPQTNNRLGLKGVCAVNGRFKASIGRRGKSVHLGYFATAGEAHAAYMAAARKQWGEFARAE